MDGNSRWARERHLDTAFGHKKGVETVEAILDHASALGVKAVTVYAFSSENWKRPENEKSVLFDLLRYFFTSRLKKIIEKNAVIRIIGDRSRFSPEIQTILKNSETSSAANTGCRIQIALSYGGRDEIIRGIKAFTSAVSRGEAKVDDLNEESFKVWLDTGSDYSEPELLIRTGGDQRLSNFLLYQSAYTELYFTKTLWPDFTAEEFDKAVCEFQNRERRFGGRQ